MRTAPVFIPEEKAKQTIMDLKVQQRDNRVRLSWRINQNERINRLKKLGFKSGKGDYFLIHQKLIKFDCEDCEPTELTDLKVMIPSGSVIQNGNKIFYYLQFPENSLNIHSYQISHYGTNDEIFSSLIEKYGQWIVYDPGISKNTLLLWTLPLLLFLIGGAIIANRIFKKDYEN